MLQQKRYEACEDRGDRAVSSRRIGVNRNPCLYIEPFPEDPFLKYAPPPEDLNAVLMAATPEEKEIIKVVYHTFGGRVGEVLSMKWEDVNFEAKYVDLWTRKRRRGELKTQRKPMTDTLYLAFRRR